MNKTLIIIICLAASAILGVFVVYPKYVKLKVETENVKVQSQNLVNRRTYYQDLSALNDELQKYSSELAKIDFSLPKEVFPTIVFDFFQKEVAQSGMVLKAVSVSEGAPSAKYSGLKEYAVGLVVSGPYSVFKNFLASTEKSARLLEIKNMSFSSPPKKEEPFSVDLSISFYSY
jgi:hypothetical protein